MVWEIYLPKWIWYFFQILIRGPAGNTWYTQSRIIWGQFNKVPHYGGVNRESADPMGDWTPWPTMVRSLMFLKEWKRRPVWDGWYKRPSWGFLQSMVSPQVGSLGKKESSHSILPFSGWRNASEAGWPAWSAQLWDIKQTKQRAVILWSAGRTVGLEIEKKRLMGSSGSKWLSLLLWDWGQWHDVFVALLQVLTALDPRKHRCMAFLSSRPQGFRSCLLSPPKMETASPL